MVIIYDENVTKEIESALLKEPSIYKAADDSGWLFIDDTVYNEISKKLQFDLETEERETIYPHTVRDYIEVIYEQTEMECLGVYIESIGCFAKDVVELIKNDQTIIMNNNWNNVIDQLVKHEAMKYIMNKIKNELIEMKADGYDLSVLKEVL